MPVAIGYALQVFQAPFSVSIDDKMEAVVLTIRGTLSIKDAMTDLSVSMVDVEPEYRNPHVEGKQCMHKVSSIGQEEGHRGQVTEVRLQTHVTNCLCGEEERERGGRESNTS